MRRGVLICSLVRRTSTAALALWLGGCGIFTDPAVRLAYCLERANDAAQVTCDPQVDGPYTVLLYPQGTLGDEELRGARLPAEAVATVQAHRARIGTGPTIYVLAASSPNGMTFTSYQKSFIDVPKVLVAAKRAGQTVEFSIEKPNTRPVIAKVN